MNSTGSIQEQAWLADKCKSLTNRDLPDDAGNGFGYSCATSDAGGRVRLEEKHRSATLLARSRVRRGLFVLVLAAQSGAWAQMPMTNPDATPAQTGETSTPQKDLTKASIEDLMNIDVTSASKTEQKLSRVAAAVFVISQDDIRRSGATNVPDLLRMVPGLDVAQINGSTWAIGARGFNQQFSNKLLVMVDGRIVYTPNFAGVYWDMVDLPLEDIDRIEVIRGPGGSIWGANAVNGVISIFTKRSGNLHGAMVSAVGGNLVQGSGTLEYGGKIAKDTDFRVFTKYFNDAQMAGLTGLSGADGWHMLRGGFRTDSQLSAKDAVTVEGSLYTGREGELGFFLPSVTSPSLIAVAEEISYGGGFIQSNWHHQYSNPSDSDLQISLTRYRRDDPLEPETRNTLYVDYQHHVTLGGRQDLIFGGGYYVTGDQIGGSLTVSFNPPSKRLDVENLFIQDEIALIRERLYFTVGTKLENNDYTGVGFMPSIGATWTPGKRQMFWAAVSRALRTPSRNDTNLVVNLGSFANPSGTPILERFLGSPSFQNERLIAYEAGYRTTISKRLSLDIAAYFNHYNRLQTTEPAGTFFEPAPTPAHQVETVTYENLMYGETHGFEIAANWKIKDWWSISPGFAFANEHMHLRAGSLDTTTVPFVEGNAPDHMAQLRSHLELRGNVALDGSAYYTDPLTNQGPLENVRIPAYTRVDAGLTWKPVERVSVSIAGQNLLKDHHLEFDDVFGSMQSGQIKRSGYIKVTWQF